MSVTGTITYIPKYGEINQSKILGVINSSPISGYVNRSIISGRTNLAQIYGIVSISDVYIEPILYCDEALALFARMSVQPSALLADLIDKTIIDLKVAGVWDKLDCYYRFDLHTQQASLLNWKGDLYNATAVNGIAWNTTLGFTGAATKYLNSNFNPSTNGVNYTLNSASQGITMIDQQIGTWAGLIGALSSASAKAVLYARATDNMLFNYINSSLYMAGGIPRIGMMGQQRLNIMMQTMVNGNSAANASRASAEVPSINVFMLCTNNSGTPTYISIATACDAFIGGNLGYGAGSAHLALYNINKYFRDNIDSVLLGPELNPDPYFNDDSLWTSTTSNWTISNNTATFAGGTADNLILKAPPINANVVGEQYRIVITHTAALANVYIEFSSGTGGVTGSGTFTKIVNCGSATEYFGIRTGTPGDVTYFSIKKVIG